MHATAHHRRRAAPVSSPLIAASVSIPASAITGSLLYASGARQEAASRAVRQAACAAISCVRDATCSVGGGGGVTSRASCAVCGARKVYAADDVGNQVWWLLLWLRGMRSVVPTRCEARHHTAADTRSLSGVRTTVCSRRLSRERGSDPGLALALVLKLLRGGQIYAICLLRMLASSLLHPLAYSSHRLGPVKLMSYQGSRSLAEDAAAADLVETFPYVE
eukprot:scaffold7894_cov444-Prasinococcus_capsulatus_cf.AAC.1